MLIYGGGACAACKAQMHVCMLALGGACAHHKHCVCMRVHLVRSNIHTAIALPASFSDRNRLSVLNQRPLLLGKGGAASTNAASTNSTAGCFDPPPAKKCCLHKLDSVPSWLL